MLASQAGDEISRDERKGISNTCTTIVTGDEEKSRPLLGEEIYW
jgi:hypothetical protein